MNNFLQRDYYKIFSGTNELNGNDKIYLGYESASTEIIFKKDSTTFFHVPFFTTPRALNNSFLIEDGATPGSIPALADRIQQKLGNYGEVGYWGTPKIADSNGTWLCSWLYERPNQPPIWLDRYYNPGQFEQPGTLEESQQAILIAPYTPNNPVFFDIPSTMILEPGVWYQYFHHGEKTAQYLVETLAGEDKQKLRLDINDWKETLIDNSIYNNKGYITNFKSTWSLDLKEPNVVDRNVLNLNNTDYIDTRVIYSSSYNLPNEFTINFWIQNNDWKKATSSQLVGNVQDGGFGVFYNNLNYNPYFVVPENFYGHIFYYNSEGDNFLDKNTQPVTNISPLSAGTSTPVYVAINSDNETVVLNSGLEPKLYKTDHTGAILAVARDVIGDPYFILGIPKLLAIDGNNNCHVVTTDGTYIFNKDLTFISFSNATPYREFEQIAFSPLNGQLVRELSCVDIKFDKFGNKWLIDLTGHLYNNFDSLSSLPGSLNCTNLAIDPENNVWVLHDYNKITKIDTNTKQKIATFTVGLENNTNIQSSRNISFIHTYFREKNIQTWYALIYTDYEKVLYQVTLNGEIYKTTSLPTNLNIKQTPPNIQDKNNLQFTSKGDFTGYDWRRIFHQFYYKDNPQLQFKLSVKRPTKNTPYSSVTASVPVHYFTNKTWHMITCMVKNRTMFLYIDSKLRDIKNIPGNYLLNSFRKNDLYIGTPCGKFGNLNYELNSKALIFNGYIDNIKIYDYAIPEKYLILFVRQRFIAKDLIWNIPTASIQYVEGIDRVFKHKVPGIKSPFFNLRISGLKITDKNTQKTIEATIKETIERIKPAYSELVSIKWVD